ETDECNKTICHRQVASVRGVSSGQGQCGLGWCGSAVDRSVRAGSEGQPLQDLESDVFRKLLSATGQSGRHSEKEWWGTHIGRSDGSGSRGADGGQAGDRAGTRGAVSARFLRVSSRKIGAGSR